LHIGFSGLLSNKKDFSVAITQFEIRNLDFDIFIDMALTEIEQFKNIIADSKHILIALPTQAEIDWTASALALQMFLLANHKQADIVSANFILLKVWKHSEY